MARRFGGMGHYRVYQLDPSDHVAAGFSIECPSDNAAISAGRNLLARSAGVEVWQGNRCVVHLEPTSPRLWDELRDEWMAS